jgi:hypothetical protein
MRTRCDRLLSAALALCSACGTYTTYQTAEPLPRGRWQGSLAATPGLFVDVEASTPTPTVINELAVRYGVGGETDLGFKIYSVGGELSVRHRVGTGTWQWALLGAVAWARTDEQGGTTEAWLGQLRLGSVITRRTSARWAFSFGPLATGSAYTFAGGGSAHGLMLGAFGNAQRTLGDARRWHLIPELSVHATLAGDVPVDGFVTMVGLAIARDF